LFSFLCIVKQFRSDPKIFEKKYFSKFTEHTTDEKINFTFSFQNGIWVKFYHFWPKNDGEKWFRKNIFEIPPCAHTAS
jgi:hypothetical protein